MKNRIRFIKVRDVKSPSRSNEGDAGLDFYMPSDLTTQDIMSCNSLDILSCNSLKDDFPISLDDNYHVSKIRLNPHRRILIPSGIKILLEPKDSMMIACNKSGLSTKKGLIFTAQVCDSPYTGEYHIGIYNTSNESAVINAGEKIMQFVHVPIYLTEPEEITQAEFDSQVDTWGTRGSNGFGSTDLEAL